MASSLGHSAAVSGGGACNEIGMRRGEVLGLRWSDIDLDAGTVTIRSTRVRFGTTITTSTPKTARGNRAIAIGPATAAALRAWKRQQRADHLLAGDDEDAVLRADSLLAP